MILLWCLLSVARTAIERGPHVLEVSGKKYNLSVTECHDALDPDEVRLLMPTEKRTIKDDANAPPLPFCHRWSRVCQQ